MTKITLKEIKEFNNTKESWKKLLKEENEIMFTYVTTFKLDDADNLDAPLYSIVRVIPTHLIKDKLIDGKYLDLDEHNVIKNYQDFQIYPIAFMESHMNNTETEDILIPITQKDMQQFILNNSITPMNMLENSDFVIKLYPNECIPNKSFKTYKMNDFYSYVIIDAKKYSKTNLIDFFKNTIINKFNFFEFMHHEPIRKYINSLDCSCT